jgi:aspartyl-tRNA(Asn)/glutamyl-tRNA(Gln) amidotransferase subunit C
MAGTKVEFGPETVRKVADLARLKLSDDEVQKFTVQVSNVLGYIEKLNEINTDGVEPMTHALDLLTPTREDVARPSPGAERMTGLAPDALHEQFKVPQVMGGGQ